MIKILKSSLIKKVVSGILTAILVVGIAAAPSQSGEAASLKLNKKSASVKVGKTVKLKVKGKFSGKIKWSSSKKKIATVNSKGVVKGVKKGKAVITAKVGGKKLKCKVTVKAAKGSDNGSSDNNGGNGGQAPSGQGPADQVTPASTDVPATPVPTDTPEPEPTPTPKYMQEGAFVYEGLDISWIDPEKPMVAFTFDDGPVGTTDTATSMRILNALKDIGDEYGTTCHATFNYITGNINNNNRAEILRALEDGHEIGNHTTGYDSLSSYSADRIASDVETARQALSDLTGFSAFTLRPPNLALNNDVYHNVPVPMIGVSIDSQDWNNATRDQIVTNVKRAKDGDIVLMHETQKNTADAIEELIRYFLDNDFQIVSAVELFAVKDIPLFAENYYNCTYRDPDRPSN